MLRWFTLQSVQHEEQQDTVPILPIHIEEGLSMLNFALTILLFKVRIVRLQCGEDVGVLRTATSSPDTACRKKVIHTHEERRGGLGGMAEGNKTTQSGNISHRPKFQHNVIRHAPHISSGVAMVELAPTTNPLRISSQVPQIQKGGCHIPLLSSDHPLDRWFHLVLAPTGPLNGSHHIGDGFIQLYSSQHQRAVLLIKDWVTTWNSAFFGHEGSISQTCPMLYLFSFISFHHTVWKVTTLVSAYVFLVLVFFLLRDGLSAELVTLIFESGFICLVVGPLLVKGSYSAESTRVEPTRCVKSSNRLFASSGLSRNLSLLDSIFTATKLASSSAPVLILDLEEERGDIEALKVLDLQDPISITGLYYYLEAMTAFLQDTSCANCVYRPPSQMTTLLRVGFFGSIGFGAFLWCYQSVTYFLVCGSGLNLFSSTLPAYCPAKSWEFLCLGCSLLICASLIVLSIMYLTLLTLLLYTAHLMTTLMDFWTQRYKPLRLVQRADLEAEFGDKSEGSQWDGEAKMKTVHERAQGEEEEQGEVFQRRKFIFNTLERDAHERYLLVRYFAQEISVRWSPFIACSLVLNVACCVGGYFIFLVTYTRHGVMDLFCLLVIAYNAVALLFIVVTVAYANTNVDQLKAHFVQSADGDYSLIGGREAWLAFINQTPVHWTVFGFPITITWIVSILASIVTAIGGVVGAPFLF
jgi:hypothetical protein